MGQSSPMAMTKIVSTAGISTRPARAAALSTAARSNSIAGPDQLEPSSCAPRDALVALVLPSLDVEVI